ncbi:MAG: hypothetical protein QM638_19720 [Nocardioides sp.]|uniref:hypothetical protein n=1 Tax=Nocardioides sp. TaxID=35761 RepID=UPI0039E6FC83
MVGSRVSAAGEGLHPPVLGDLARLLRLAVWEHHAAEPRRSHLPILHLGQPGGRQLVFPDRHDEPTDHALRVDIVAAMRHHSGQPSPLVWLTRSGDLALADVDARWLAAARQAFAEAEVPLVFVVVNRQGWRDPRSGHGRVWSRIRHR